MKDNLTISLPRLVNEWWSKILLVRLSESLLSRSTVSLDASKTEWLSPFGTILLADFALKRIENGLKTSIIMPAHIETRKYIKSSGLLKLTTASTDCEAIGINHVELRLLKAMEPLVIEQMSDFVSRQAINLGTDERALIRIWMTELLTNANDHANSKRGFWLCARYDHRKQDIRICVADSGIGIRQSLINSQKYGKQMNDEQAIVKALEEGVTSRIGRTGGLGLKHISAYVKSHGGSMTILSGKAKVYIARKTKRLKVNPVFVDGTIVNVSFNTSTMTSSDDLFDNQSPFIFEV